MPLYRYATKDGKEVTKLMRYKDRTDTISVDGEIYTLQLPKTTSTTVMETADTYHGKKKRKDVEKQLRTRMVDHHDKYELAEKIDKYGLEEAMRLKWTKKIKRT